jgi:hypothetical protein
MLIFRLDEGYKIALENLNRKYNQYEIRNNIAVFQRAIHTRVFSATYGAKGGAFMRFCPSTITVQWFCARVMPL